MGLGMGDVRNQRTLAVVSLGAANAQGIPQFRAGAVRHHQQFRLKGCAGFQRHLHIFVANRTRRDHLVRGPGRHRRAVQGLYQHIAQPGVLDDIAQGGPALVRRAHAGAAKTPLCGHMDSLDGAGPFPQPVPQFQFPVDEATAVGQGGGPGIEGRAVCPVDIRLARRQRGFLHQQQPAVGPQSLAQAVGQTGAHHAAPSYHHLQRFVT